MRVDKRRERAAFLSSVYRGPMDAETRLKDFLGHGTRERCLASDDYNTWAGRVAQWNRSLTPFIPKIHFHRDHWRLRMISHFVAFGLTNALSHFNAQSWHRSPVSENARHRETKSRADFMRALVDEWATSLSNRRRGRQSRVE